jgi:hypothetical protein
MKDTYYLIFLDGWRIVHSIWKQIGVDDLLRKNLDARGFFYCGPDARGRYSNPCTPCPSFYDDPYVFVFAFAFYYKILFE